MDDQLVFRIGDFGLSKLIFDATHHKKAKHHHHHHHHDNKSPSDNDACVIKPSESPYRHHPTEITWHDPLTAGVGTLSYASPEQQVSRSYGKAADVYSLGLILLELMCSFTTEHERLMNFSDCRQRRRLPSFLTEHYPIAAKVILDCTNHDPAKRPTTAELLTVDILPKHELSEDCPGNMSKQPNCVTQDNNEQRLIQELRNELNRKNEIIQRYETEMTAKDNTIAELRREIEHLRLGHKGRNQPPGNVRTCPDGIAIIHDDDHHSGLNGEDAPSSSSSSEDGI